MFKIGNSIDNHNLVPETTQQKLGGIIFETQYKVVAHSDGDVILHAVAESILGALGLGDLGEHFSDTDVKNKNLDSEIILEKALSLMDERGYMVSNLDLTVVCDLIMFKDKKSLIKAYLQTKLQTENINVKATRFEDKTLLKITCFCGVLLNKKTIY
ncbi:2-C-methyl-D-erythritol 2,4-cyclodiphosphate synthase [Ureaplasma ceti]|uniref:2-C-methyl-D-erythritol 2,4-cyclodiphosphate synthase n=1 Tax=Ureaplasma ceti TaxID=3119530 RepID=A0ABP9UCH7_9BACT